MGKIDIQIRRCKSDCIGHTHSKPTSNVTRHAMRWNLQRKRCRNHLDKMLSSFAIAGIWELREALAVTSCLRCALDVSTTGTVLSSLTKQQTNSCILLTCRVAGHPNLQLIREHVPVFKSSVLICWNLVKSRDCLAQVLRVQEKPFAAQSLWSTH